LILLKKYDIIIIEIEKNNKYFGVNNMKTKLILPKLHIELERWKYNKGLDVYVSSFGNFKNKNGINLHTGVCNGYVRFKGKPVHRIVLSMFAPVPGWESLTVDHLDHNTRNNRVSNLE
jgi:hypothetical protein